MYDYIYLLSLKKNNQKWVKSKDYPPIPFKLAHCLFQLINTPFNNSQIYFNSFFYFSYIFSTYKIYFLAFYIFFPLVHSFILATIIENTWNIFFQFKFLNTQMKLCPIINSNKSFILECVKIFLYPFFINK